MTNSRQGGKVPLQFHRVTGTSTLQQGAPPLRHRSAVVPPAGGLQSPIATIQLCPCHHSGSAELHQHHREPRTGAYGTPRGARCHLCSFQAGGIEPPPWKRGRGASPAPL